MSITNCNIIRNSNKNEFISTANSNNIKHFQEKNFNRFNNRPQIDNNNNVPYRPHRYNKYKRFYKKHDELLPTDSDISNSIHNDVYVNNKLKSFSFEFVNGDDGLENETSLFVDKSESFTPEKMFELNKKKFNVSSSYSSKLTGYTVEFDRDLESNAGLVESANLVARHIHEDPMSMENQLKSSSQEDCAHVITTDKYNHAPSKTVSRKSAPESLSIESSVIRTGNTEIKLNFLQESQLTSEQLNNTDRTKNSKPLQKSTDSIVSKCLSNGLNPSAMEFTPCTNWKPDKSPRDRLKLAQLDATITNPLVLDDSQSSSNLVSPTQFASFYEQAVQFGSQKLASHDSAGFPAPSFYSYPSVPIGTRPGPPRINYNSTQLQLAVYGPGPPLVRYNQHASGAVVPLSGGYLVYGAPVLVNGGVYNPLLPSSRLFSIGGPGPGAAVTELSSGGPLHSSSFVAHGFPGTASASGPAAMSAPAFLAAAIDANANHTASALHIR